MLICDQLCHHLCYQYIVVDTTMYTWTTCSVRNGENKVDYYGVTAFTIDYGELHIEMDSVPITSIHNKSD
jgi:hypothetical protein